MGGQPAVPALRKRGRPTAAERRTRESEILATALGVFLRSGYGASTIDELAAAAQVTKRTLYAYYGDKSGLFTAMVRELAAAVSLDASADNDTLETLAARIVSRVHSDELVALHQLVIGESARFPELAQILHSNGDARHIARLAEHIRAERSPAAEHLAEPLFSLLLGERHRRRLLGIDPAPSAAQAAAHAHAAIAQLGLLSRWLTRVSARRFLPRLDSHAGTALVHGQIGQAVVAGGEAAGRAVRQPGDRALGEPQRVPGGAEDAVARHDEKQDVEIRLGVRAHVLPRWQVDEVGVELASRFCELPQRARGPGQVPGEGLEVAEDAGNGQVGTDGAAAAAGKALWRWHDAQSLPLAAL
jgi:TetR/AcrR family transcriptional regulator, mexJK operon transcriptional repressor